MCDSSKFSDHAHGARDIQHNDKLMSRNTISGRDRIGRYNHCLSFDATIMLSKNCPIIGEHVVIIFLTQ